MTVSNDPPSAEDESIPSSVDPDAPPVGERGDWDDAIHDAEDLYTDADMRWGPDAQMAKAAEEFSELAAECARDLNRQADQEAFLEELVDARVMLEQLAQHVTDDALEDAVDEALDDLQSRVEAEGSE